MSLLPRAIQIRFPGWSTRFPEDTLGWRAIKFWALLSKFSGGGFDLNSPILFRIFHPA
jgi:hypothetical protein